MAAVENSVTVSQLNLEFPCDRAVLIGNVLKTVETRDFSRYLYIAVQDNIIQLRYYSVLVNY